MADPVPGARCIADGNDLAGGLPGRCLLDNGHRHSLNSFRCPALAVGVGSVTGIIVGFSAQNLLGSIIAGTLLAIVRPIKVGDEITVMGNTGRVVEIGIMFTRIDAGERLVLIPNVSMMTNVILRKKEPAGG